MGESKAEIARQAIEQWNSSGEVAWQFYTEDVQIRNLPDGPWQPSPGRKGIQEWIDFTDEIAAEWSLHFDSVEELDENRLLTASRLRMKFRSSGIEDELPLVQLVSFDGDLINRVEAYYTREQALEAAGLSEGGAP